MIVWVARVSCCGVSCNRLLIIATNVTTSGADIKSLLGLVGCRSSEHLERLVRLRHCAMTSCFRPASRWLSLHGQHQATGDHCSSLLALPPHSTEAHEKQSCLRSQVDYVALQRHLNSSVGLHDERGASERRMVTRGWSERAMVTNVHIRDFLAR